VIDVAPERFEQLVGQALDAIPAELASRIDNVVVCVEDDSDEGLYGLYEGTPLTERYDYGGLATPDSITIFRLPILGDATSEAEVVEQVRITVIHELAHHFGIDDDRLDELGWS
jgi:predicted Zn-dependent protease with MMP-like domain